MAEITFCRFWAPYCLWLPVRQACHPQPSTPGSVELVSLSSGTRRLFAFFLQIVCKFFVKSFNGFPDLELCILYSYS